MPEEKNQTPNKNRILKLIFAWVGILFCISATMAVIKAYFRGAWQSGPLIGIAILIALIAAMAGLGYLTYKIMVDHRNQTGPLSKKERLNRDILIGCGVLGIISGLALANLSSDAGYIYSDAKIPTIVAVVWAAVFGILLPIISIFWHRRAIDEQEVHAYREGAYYALSFYAIAAPVWWILWRGELMPEPNGVIIYHATIIIMGVVWVKKKYF